MPDSAGMTRTLNIADPTMPPTPISKDPARAVTTTLASSGKLDPTATTTDPLDHRRQAVVRRQVFRRRLEPAAADPDQSSRDEDDGDVDRRRLREQPAEHIH